VNNLISEQEMYLLEQKSISYCADKSAECAYSGAEGRALSTAQPTQFLQIYFKSDPDRIKSDPNWAPLGSLWIHLGSSLEPSQSSIGVPGPAWGTQEL